MKLQPGETYTVQVEVTNQSRYLTEPCEAELDTAIEAVANGIELIHYTVRTDMFGPGQSLVFTWELHVPSDTPASSGAITVTVYDPNDRTLAQASISIEVVEEEQEPEPEPEPEPDPSALTIAELIIDRNYILVVAQGVEPEGRRMRLRTRVYRLNGTYYASSRGTYWYSGEPTYANISLELEGPAYDPYPYIVCTLHDVSTDAQLATRTFEGPFYAE